MVKIPSLNELYDYLTRVNALELAKTEIPFWIRVFYKIECVGFGIVDESHKRIYIACKYENTSKKRFYITFSAFDLYMFLLKKGYYKHV